MGDSTRLQQRREEARKRMHSSASTPSKKPQALTCDHFKQTDQSLLYNSSTVPQSWSMEEITVNWQIHHNEPVETKVRQVGNWLNWCSRSVYYCYDPDGDRWWEYPWCLYNCTTGGAQKQMQRKFEWGSKSDSRDLKYPVGNSGTLRQNNSDYIFTCYAK